MVRQRIGRSLHRRIAVLIVACHCSQDLATRTALIITVRGAQVGTLINGPEVRGVAPRLAYASPGYIISMASTKQAHAARRNVNKAQTSAAEHKSISHLPKAARSSLGKQGAAVAARKRSGASEPKTRTELYEIAKRRDIAGRSKMGRDELAKALGEH